MLKTVLALVLIMGETVLYGVGGVENYTLQLGLGITIFLGISRGFTLNAYVLVAILYPINWAVKGEFGHYLLALVSIFFLLRIVSSQMKVFAPQFVFIAFVSSLAHSSFMILFTFLTNPESHSISAMLSSMWIGAIFATMGALCVGLLMSWVGRRFSHPSKSSFRLDL